MRFLSEDRTSAVTAGSTLSGFPAANVKNDRPKNAWISATQSGETFTVSLDASPAYPVEAFFLHGILADSCTWELKNNAGSTVDSGSLDMDFPLDSNLAGNPNNSNTYFNNQGHLLRSFFIIFGTQVTDNGSLILTLATSFNMGSSNVEGNAVASWVRDSSKAGRLLDSAGNAINIHEHGRIFVGSWVIALTLANPLTENTRISSDTSVVSPWIINGGVELSIDGDKTLTATTNATSGQISSISGDGTALSSITLSDDVSTVAVANVFNPVLIGIARCGGTIDISNPQAGLSENITDFSVRRTQPTGGYSYEQRPVARNFSGGCLLSTAQAKTVKNFYRGFRSKPFPVLLADDMPTAFDAGREGNVFGFFTTPPAFNFMNKEYQSITFSIREVV